MLLIKRVLNALNHTFGIKNKEVVLKNNVKFDNTTISRQISVFFAILALLNGTDMSVYLALIIVSMIKNQIHAYFARKVYSLFFNKWFADVLSRNRCSMKITNVFLVFLLTFGIKKKKSAWHVLKIENTTKLNKNVPVQIKNLIRIKIIFAYNANIQ